MINNTDAIESLLSSLIDAEQWILFLKIKSFKTIHQKQIEEGSFSFSFSSFIYFIFFKEKYSNQISISFRLI